MKKLPLCNNKFGGDVNGISRRAILNELSGNHYRFGTRPQQIIKKGYRFYLVFLVGMLLGLSLGVVWNWNSFDNGYKSAMYQIYKGNAQQVEKNKRAVIAGIGDDGYRKVQEGE